MLAKTRSLFILIAVLMLALTNILPARADVVRFFSANSTSMSDFPILEVKYYIP